MGEVYRAEAEGSGLIVAVETLPLALVGDPKVVLRTPSKRDARKP